jgi:hypothetical protein
VGLAKILRERVEFRCNVNALPSGRLTRNALKDAEQELRWCEDTAMLGATMFTLEAI